MRPKLVALDIDGTLLDSSGELRPAVRRAVREAMRGDVVVTLATGRRFDTAADVAAELGVEVPLVLHGGAVIQDSLTGEVLYEDAMPAALLREVVEEVVREGRQPVLYRSPAVNDLLAGPRELDNPASATYLERQPCVRRLPVEELARAEHVISVGVLHQEDVLRPLYERFRSWPTCSALLWEPEPLWPDYPYLLDVVNAGCSKAKALAHFAGTYGIQMGEVMAIGDQINDVDMIEAVGFGVAMGNAIPAVRERAQVVVGTNDEDGVVEALRRFVLNGETPE